MTGTLPPPLHRLVGETLAMRRRLLFSGIEDAGPMAPDAGRPVIIFPAFMVHEMFCRRLCLSLISAGYDARTWGMGLNRGLEPDMMVRLQDLVAETHERTGRKVALVGWSLGGLFAREVAKIIPDAVERVVTLASPFSGDPRANNVWRIYEWKTGHKVDAPPIDVVLTRKPPVPTFALWSRKDGVVAPDCCRGAEGECDFALEVDCNHTDFVSNRKGVAATLEALAERTP